MRPGIIKKTILSIGLFCLLFSIIFTSDAHAQVLSSDTKVQAGQTSAASTLKATEAKTSAWVKAGSAAYGAAIKSVLNTIAYDTATWIGSGGKGQKPQFITEGWGTYLSNVADSAAGTFIETLGKEGFAGSKFNLCEPNFDVTLKIGLGLTQQSRPKAPACTFSKMTNNWKTAADKWKDMSSQDYLQKAAGMFEPASNDIGLALTVQTGIIEDVEKEVGNKDKERSTGGGWLDVRNIGGSAQTAPNEAQRQIEQTRMLQSGNLGQYTGEALKDAANVFLNQLAITAFNTLMTNLTAEDTTSVYKGDYGGLADAESQNTGGGAAAVENNATLSLNPYKFTTRADYDILAELVMCPNPNKAGPTNCVITDKFMQAVTERKTVGEALNEGYLNKNGTFGFSKDGYEPKYIDESYPYRSMLILRKFRIIPAGWEVAAQYIKSKENDDAFEGMNLEKMIQCFDQNDSYEGYYDSWCQGLVDPNWVLKAPKNYCKRQGFGPELLSNVVTGQGQDSSIALTRNGDYCADEQSCILENDDGSCQAYGYCVKEKRKWNFNAESCDAKYNTCQTFKSEDGKSVSYLENTLDYTGCSADNAGCKAYSYEYDYSAASWSDQSSKKIYFDRDADTCDSNNEGCHEFIRTKPGVGANLLENPSFEDDLSGTIWEGSGTSVEDAYDGIKSLEISGNLSKAVTFQISGQNSFNVAGERFALSLYAKGCSSDATFGIKDTSNALPALSSAADSWTRNETAYVYPSTLSSDQVTFEINNTSANCRIDAVKLERGGQATAYSGYRTDGVVYEKLLPDYLSDNGAPNDNLCYDETGALKSGAPAECSNFVRSCTADEVNCEMYTSATDGVGIPGKVTAQDYCAGECVGYDTYVQQGTTFDTSRYSYFIPSSAASCGAESSGCEEFTNLDSTAQGGEGVEYYSYLRQCIKPDAEKCGEFYAWEGSDETGYQLKVMQLEKNGNEPKTTSSDAAECSDAIYSLPSTDASYNADCRQFYDKSGAISYHLMTKTITCSDSCFAYRMTRKNVDPNITSSADCSGDDRYWDSAGDGQCYKCENGGTWDSQQNACIYKAIPGEGTTCTAQNNGCREYSGNTGNNMSIILNNDFEGSLQDWTAVTGSSASSSNDALLVGGRSLSVTGGSNPSAVSVIGTSVIEDKSYVLSFIAKARSVNVSLSATIGNASASTAFSGSSVLSQSEWKRFEMNMIKLDHSVSSDEMLGIAGTGDFYIDDVRLTEISDRYYLIRDSWTTPDSCNQDENGNPYPLFALGCDAYTDRDNNTHYLHSFTRLCQDSAVGCELMIDTNNSADYKQETTAGDPAVTTPADEFVYVVFDKARQCSAIDKGCQRFGDPYEYDTYDTVFSDAYLKNDPDKYTSILCGSDAVQCGEWSTSDGTAYFRDPGDQVCEWRQHAATSNSDTGGFGWYKKKVKKCTSGTEINQVCLSDKNCQVDEISATSTCATKEEDIACPVSNIKTFGKGGYEVAQPTADANGNYWAGTCPTSANNCTEYIDPTSKFSTDLVAGGQVRLSPDTLYVFQGGSSVSSCENKDGSSAGSLFHKLGSDNKMSATGASSMSVTSGSNALVYVADNDQDIYCSASGIIRKAGIDYQDKSKVDTKTCNGMVDFDKGCILFNERAQNGGSGMASFTYDSFTTDAADAISSVGTFPQSLAGANNANKILKVYPDRDCDEWLGCKSSNDTGVCTDIAICTKLDENSACERFKADESPRNQTYPTNVDYKYIADKSGYYKASYANINSDDEIHPHPDDYYQFENATSTGMIGNITNGSFELNEVSSASEVDGVVDYSTDVKYWPTDGWDCETSGDANCIANTDVLNNPYSIQKDRLCFRYDSNGNCTVYAPEGRAILKMTAPYGSVYKLQTKMGDEMSIHPSSDASTNYYYVTGYVNTSKLSMGSAVVKVEELKFNNTATDGSLSYSVLRTHTAFSLAGAQGWTAFFYPINGNELQSGATNFRIILAAEGNAQGSYYFDDIKIRPALFSRDDWKTQQTCRLYPQEDSLSCDYYDNSGVRYKGLYGYCLDYDRYPGTDDSCLLWWPVPNINNNANDASELNEVCGDGQANGNEDCDCRDLNDPYCQKDEPNYYNPAGTSGSNQYACSSCGWTDGWCGDNIVEETSPYSESCDWNENKTSIPNLNGTKDCMTGYSSNNKPLLKKDFEHAGPNAATPYYYDYLYGNNNYLDGQTTTDSVSCYNNTKLTAQPQGNGGVDRGRCRIDTTNCSDVLVNGAHTRAQCITAGGVVVSDSATNNGAAVTDPSGNILDKTKVGNANKNYFCKFSASSCVSGWTQYGNWSSTNQFHCHKSSECCTNSHCSGCYDQNNNYAGPHAFSNTAQEYCTSGNCCGSGSSGWAPIYEIGCY